MAGFQNSRREADPTMVTSRSIPAKKRSRSATMKRPCTSGLNDTAWAWARERCAPGWRTPSPAQFVGPGDADRLRPRTGKCSASAGPRVAPWWRGPRRSCSPPPLARPCRRVCACNQSSGPSAQAFQVGSLMTVCNLSVADVTASRASSSGGVLIVSGRPFLPSMASVDALVQQRSDLEGMDPSQAGLRFRRHRRVVEPDAKGALARHIDTPLSSRLLPVTRRSCGRSGCSALSSACSVCPRGTRSNGTACWPARG